MTTQLISATDLQKACTECDEVNLIDVRTPAEFQEIHVPDARNVPLNHFDPAKFTDPDAESRPIYVICKSGKRAEMACKKLTESGRENVYCVEGGTDAWAATGLPVTRGKKTIGLERQVRLIAGTMIVVGATLAILVNPLWAILPGVCGIGLLHAGLTDSCLMGMLLAPMPWNQASCDSA